MYSYRAISRSWEDLLGPLDAIPFNLFYLNCVNLAFVSTYRKFNDALHTTFIEGDIPFPLSLVEHFDFHIYTRLEYHPMKAAGRKAAAVFDKAALLSSLPCCTCSCPIVEFSIHLPIQTDTAYSSLSPPYTSSSLPTPLSLGFV